MNIAETLLADPTYALMSPAERRGEALELMKTAGLGDDPLDAALAVEEADARLAAGDLPQAAATPSEAPGVEPCREKWGEGCTKPVAATGRCMECGARRVAPTVDLAPIPPGRDAPWPPGPEVQARITQEHAPEPAEPFPSPPGYRVPAPGFLARFKASTGNNDRQIGDLLGMARSSVQAVVGGRVGENLTPAQLEQLAEALDGQLAHLVRLRAEISGSD